PQNGSWTTAATRVWHSIILAATPTAIPAPCTSLPTSTPWSRVVSCHPSWLCPWRMTTGGPGRFHVHTCSQSDAARFDDAHHGAATRAFGLHQTRLDHSSQSCLRKRGQYSSAIGYSHTSSVPAALRPEIMSP